MPRDFCFSLLALQPKYQRLAQGLIDSLAQHAPGTPVVVGTDDPTAFQDYPQVSAFALRKQGILHCYHDKRFVIERALASFQTVIQIDADSRFCGPLALAPPADNAIAAVCVQDLLAHVQKYTPERLPHLHKLAAKLAVNLQTTQFVGESLFAVSAADSDRATTFLRQWDRLARYLQLHGVHAGEGNAIGIAAAKAGLRVATPDWLLAVDRVREHLDASRQGSSQNAARKLWRRRLEYHYRLNRARLAALGDVEFYYR